MTMSSKLYENVESFLDVSAELGQLSYLIISTCAERVVSSSMNFYLTAVQ
jgi:hypothetical protein